MATRVFEKPVSRDMLDLQRSIAITASGNTHAAISTGQFVYVKNHSTLTDGLYVATDDIVEDGTLSSSNLTADTSGGLNALQAQIDDITGDIGTVPSGKTLQGQINANSAHIDNLQDGLAIVSDNNTHAAIASGQFVYVKNHGTLDEGIYKATAAIAQNETLSSSNLTAVTDGGLNAVKSAIPAVVNNLTSDSTTSALSAAQGKALNGKYTFVPKIVLYRELNSTSATVTLVRTHVYEIICAHPYNGAALAIVSGWASGDNRIKWISTNTNVSASMNEYVLTITTTAPLWVRVVDYGDHV